MTPEREAAINAAYAAVAANDTDVTVKTRGQLMSGDG